MKTLFRFILTACILVSATLLYSQESVYSFPFENEQHLPPMSYRINMEEISSTYQTYGGFYTTEITGLGKDTVEQTSYSYISDTRVMDAVRFLEFYLEEQLLERNGEKSGLVVMSIIYFNEQGRFNVGSAVAFLTLGIGALLGIPVSTNVTDVEIEATFFDSSNKEIAVHRGVGRGKKTMSLYTTSKRQAHQRALLEALETLNEKVLSDPGLNKHMDPEAELSTK